MDAVILKGTADGFGLRLNADAAVADIIEQLDALLGRLYKDTPEGNVNFTVETGNRLFDETQRRQLDDVFDQYPRFAVRMVSSGVVAASTVDARIAAAKTHFAGGMVRSGQVLTFSGDVVFAGTLHQGGQVRASGSIYVLGEAHGIVHAGFPENSSAVVAGNLGDLTQVRIADAVEIVEEGAYAEPAVCFMTDQHLLAHDKLAALKQIRPQIFDQTEEA
jgi:septum site-determining protein MinC